MASPLKLGLLGCGRVGRIAAVDALSDFEGIVLGGVASRDRARAERFAAAAGGRAVPVVHEGYEQLLASPEIDLVYVALPNHLHARWAVRAAQAGKHVLVEKPLCLDEREGEQIRSAVDASGVRLLEGVMVQHHPFQGWLVEQIERGVFGALREVETRLCFTPAASAPLGHRGDPEKGGGAFRDLGVYWLQLVQRLVGLAGAEVRGESAFAGDGGCDLSFRAGLSFPGGLEASLLCSFELPYRASHVLRFENATVSVPDIFRANIGAHKITIKVEDRRTGTLDKMVFPAQCHYTEQWRFFAEVIEGKRENIDLRQSLERVSMTNRIYQAAREAQREDQRRSPRV